MPANLPFGYRDVHYPTLAVVPDQATAAQRLAPGVLVLVAAGNRPKVLRFYCPCNCGEIVTVNVSASAEKSWEVAVRPKRGLSLWPSVWLDNGCQSHFILRDNTARLLWGRFPKMTEEQEREWWASLPGLEPRATGLGDDVVG